MKKILTVLVTLLFLSCSSDHSSAIRKITFKVNGVRKVFEDIEVQAIEDINFEVPFTRISIGATPADGSPEFFSVAVNRGGDFDGQSRNGNVFLNGNVYSYNFEHPLTLNLSINTSKRIKGTFEGIYTNEQGENIGFTEGTIDITYYPDTGTYIKK